MKNFMTSLALLACQAYGLQEFLMTAAPTLNEQKWQKKKADLLEKNPDWEVDTSYDVVKIENDRCVFYKNIGFVINPNLLPTDEPDKIEITMKQNGGEYTVTPRSFLGTDVAWLNDELESFRCGNHVNLEVCNDMFETNFVNSEQVITCHNNNKLSTHTKGAIVEAYYKERNKASSIIMRPAPLDCKVEYDMHSGPNCTGISRRSSESYATSEDLYAVLRVLDATTGDEPQPFKIQSIRHRANTSLQLFEFDNYEGGSMYTEHLGLPEGVEGNARDGTDWVCTTFKTMGRAMDQKSIKFWYDPCTEFDVQMVLMSSGAPQVEVPELIQEAPQPSMEAPIGAEEAPILGG